MTGLLRLTWIVALSTRLVGSEIAADQPAAKFHITDDGEVFVSKDQPVYFFISDHPDESTAKFPIRSGSKPKPFPATESGTHFVKLGDSKLFPVHVDGVSPDVKPVYLGSNPVTHQDVFYFGKGFDVDFFAEDAMSGVAEIFIAIDGAPYQAFREPISLTPPAGHTLRYYAVDRVGNRSAIGEVKVAIDTRAPSSKKELAGVSSGQYLSKDASITLSATDSGVGLQEIYYSLDHWKTTSQKAYGSPIKLLSLGHGSHKLRYWSQDRLGNMEPANEFEFFIDRIPPSLSYGVSGDCYPREKRLYCNKKAAISIVSKDEDSGVEQIYYGWDRNRLTAYESPIPVRSGLLKFKAHDKVGMSTETRELRITVDTESPKMTFHVSGGKAKEVYGRWFVTKDTRITLSGKDDDAGLEHILFTTKNQEKSIFRHPLTFAEDGSHTIIFEGHDRVGNISSESVINVLSDSTPPKIFPHFSKDKIGGKNVYPAGNTLYLAATDKGTGTAKIKYEINSEGIGVYQRPIVFRTPGSYTVRVMAWDELGNLAETSIAFEIQKPSAFTH